MFGIDQNLLYKILMALIIIIFSKIIGSIIAYIVIKMFNLKEKNKEKIKNDNKKFDNKSYLSSEKSDYKCRKTLNNINNSK